MKKQSGALVLGVVTLLVGWMLSALINTTDGSDQGGLVPIVKLKEYEEELKRVRGEKEDALAELNELEERMRQIESEQFAENDLLMNLALDLEKYKMASGVLDVYGPGVLITVRDPMVVDEFQEEYSVIMYNYDLLLQVVNRLKEAGAEAISINEQRIVGTTEISLAGTAVNINGAATAPPYTIKAIGNPEVMEAALTIRGGIIEEMKMKYNLTVDVAQREDVTIPRYSGVVTFKSAKPIAPEEGRVP